MLFSKQELLKSYSNQTGRFPIPSSRGNHHIFVLYHHDTNSIHATAISNRQSASIRNAWENTHKMLVAQGHPPNLHILDNECSHELKEAFAKYNIAFQRVPPTFQATSRPARRRDKSAVVLILRRMYLVTTNFRASIQTNRQLIYRYQTVIAGRLHYDDAQLVPQQCSKKTMRPLGLDDNDVHIIANNFYATYS
jgi:hypothetical protein